MRELKKVEVNVGNFKEKKHRLEEREEAVRRLGFKDGPVRNKEKIKEEMKKEMVDNMTNKYGNVTVGIHGQELPKFKEVQLATGKEWWKNAKSFTASPKNRSLVRMQQEKKWWAKNDLMRIADTDAENTPQVDVFKQVHVPKALKN